MYQALYRKYRPDDFSKIVGQDHIIEVLKNQIESDKISHAYLFHGVRGTGKTSTAKVFARAANCLNYDKEKGPCNECSACVNNEMDTIEIDAASNNSVDNIRQIRDDVIYMPNFGKYKVYIIDEVHMLSGAAFNALLKTLEEPPKHIIFILATTEIQKVTDTIKSRCQKFEFHKISKEVIYERLKEILNNENISYEDEALKVIANRSQGAMRDAISLIDQIGAYSDITLDSLSFVIGEAKEAEIERFLQKLGEKDTISTLKILEEIEKESVDIKKFPSSLINYLRKVLIDSENGDYKKIRDIFDIDNIISMIVNLSDLDVKMKESIHAKILFEAFVVKYCNGMESQNYSGNLDQIKVLENRIAKLEEKIKNSNFTAKNREETPKKEIEEVIKPKTSVEEVKTLEVSDEEKQEIQRMEETKNSVLSHLKEQKQAILAAFVVEGRIARVIKDEVYISYDKNHSFHKNKLSEKENFDVVNKAFREVSNKNLILHIIFESEIFDIENDKKDDNKSIIETLQNAFDIPKDKINIED